MAKSCALLITPVNEESYPTAMRNFVKDNYKLGWLLGFDDGAIYVTWGMATDKEKAIKCANDCFEKQGKKELLIYDKPVPKDEPLTLEEFYNIKNNSSHY